MIKFKSTIRKKDTSSDRLYLEVPSHAREDVEVDKEYNVVLEPKSTKPNLNEKELD